VLPFCDRHGIGFFSADPLAGGLLTGQYRRGSHPYIGIRRITDETFDLIERLERFAKERGRILPELAVAALVSMGFSSVVTDIQPWSWTGSTSRSGEPHPNRSEHMSRRRCGS
jgi:aryl-alcohol dehydrogenase-like predicted oxidoreductase